MKLFPSPTSSELLVAGNIDTGVETSCILFYWQVCVGDNRLPQWFEQRLLRLYIQGRAYESEGKFNRPDASKYFLARYRIVETELVNLINKIAVLPRKKVVQGGEGTNFSRRSLRIPRLIGL